MYDDSWYSYVPDSHSEKLDTSAHSTKHRRRESLLKQPNGKPPHLDTSDSMIELYEDDSKLRDPPEASLARRARSYSDFYEAAMGYLNKNDKLDRPRDTFDVFDNLKIRAAAASLSEQQEVLEGALLDSSHEDYQLYRDQLELSERHLDSLLSDTGSALDLLASLSVSFKTVESQNTAFQAQCEDLLAEQKHLRDLADEVGVDLQYYAYLEPLTRRLNAPGSGRIVKSDDFLDMLLNLNTCIEFMHQHPNYRDSTLYKTRYTSLLERSLNLVQIAFSSAVREVADDAARQLKSKDQNETAEYILLYGKFDNIMTHLGSQIEKILKTTEFAFGKFGHKSDVPPYVHQWHELFRSILDSYLKSRENVAPVVLKNLRKFASSNPKPDSDFKSFARRSVQYVLDICQNELALMEKFFENGPLFAVYSDVVQGDKLGNCLERLEANRLSHLATLHTFLSPYLSGNDLQQVCDLINWLETMYMTTSDGEMDEDRTREDRRSTVQVLLSKHLWPLSDALFLKAAAGIEHFKPTQGDLVIAGQTTTENLKAQRPRGEETDEQIQGYGAPTPAVSNAYPTVKTAVRLLIMYNDGAYDRPRAGDVLYEIVHQVTESLQKAATIIKRNSTTMDAQIFLIKNLMLIENLFMTHEIPDSVRQSAEFDFSPIWDTIKELQERKQLFNPLAYFTPFVKGQLLPAVVDHLLDARKELEKVLVQQITAFTKYWQSRLSEKDTKQREAVVKATSELESLLNSVFEDQTTRAALWKMIRAEEY